MVVDPGKAAQVEAVAGSGDSDVGEAGFCSVDGPGERVALFVLAVFVVGGRKEVLGDAYAGPFAAFGLVGGGDGDVGLVFGGELVDGVEDGVGAVLVDEVGQGARSRPEGSLSAWACSSSQERKRVSSGWVVRWPFFRSRAARARDWSAPPPPVRATRRPASRWVRTSMMAPTLVRHSTAAHGWLVVPTRVGMSGCR